jgi:hypothetical protein
VQRGMMSATDDDQGRGAASRISALSLRAVLMLAVAACGGTLAACGGNPAHPASPAAGAHPPGRPTAVADTTPAGRLTGPQRGRTVTWLQAVSGVVTGLSAGDQAWIVVDPSLAPSYWPQPGPLRLSPAGDFRITAYFGASARQDSGERFRLRLVLATPAASARLRAFQIQPAHQRGLLKMPAGVRTLAAVTVIRR